MDTYITYEQWLNNIVSHIRSINNTSIEDCPECQNNFNPICNLCDGSGIIVHGDDGHKINVSINAYNRQLEYDKVRWRKYIARCNNE
jgi:hypothetical protein